jgi:NADH-quinone oxidoreductase subunit L
VTRLLPWVPLLPFLGALLNGVVLRNRIGKGAVAAIACGSVALSCVLGIAAIAGYVGGSGGSGAAAYEVDVWEWIPAGDLVVGSAVRPFTVPFGFLLDPLACVMLFVVTFVGFLIHLYSVGYMAHEPGFQRYFTYLNLFMGMMLLLVLGNNYLVAFIGWEGVGLCSYLLIGFYYDQDFPPYAGRKAFIVNRIGDFAFVLGLFALVTELGSLRYSELFGRVAAQPDLVTQPYAMGLTLAGFVTLCLFVGATGKSAQIPLFVWLPDAMAGPTPVSALIHAATMVTAGVYMVVRSNVLYQLAPEVSWVVAGIGAATALLAATIGIAQNDIKKVLAYSTVSQLGYMFLAAGVGAYTAAIFHLGTHAFFKALLFLGSGSVIHAMGGEQDRTRMGGLRRHLPQTYWTFLIGTLAIAGMPGLAGFFSKDAILAGAYGKSTVLWVVGLLTAMLTAAYMMRAVFLTFFGEFRGTHEQQHHLHESPPVMTIPLWVLAAGAVVAGWLGAIPFTHLDWFGHFLEPVIARPAGVAAHVAHHGTGEELLLVGASIAVAALGIFVAWRIWGRRGLAGEERFAARLGPAHRLLADKYRVDELYDATVVRGTWASARGLSRFDASVIDGFLVNGTRHFTVAVSLLSGFFDKYFVDGLVNLVGSVMEWSSRGFRRLQTGLVSQYALVFAAGVFALAVCYLLVLDRL